ncbi:hypothetical protein [Luteibacter yeojuensis]|uniref:Uncharacterized protein n=1 Tax=Luteibacter yeojuensis TaxID=345309 RepID=A0A7X5TPI6_9GAMM|nr:hypothetical protein [Luteibacter yeojuensis]NID14507.1 hypothetical protein [Luteibacter yeojuensis]
MSNNRVRVNVCRGLRFLGAALMALWLIGCSTNGPQISDRVKVWTPIFSDNRVYRLEEKSSGGTQALTSLDTPPVKDLVEPNSPLTIIMRSVEIPEYEKAGPISKNADYAVIVDIGTAADGTSQSVVVWYQRGVSAGQSLNFSNLIVYYEPRWDQRVAPYFRVRVMDVTKEKNDETRRDLDRIQKLSMNVAGLASNPIVVPSVAVAFNVADLILSHEENRLVLDYSVQLYSAAAAAAAGSGGLGQLQKGSYIVVGRPNGADRTYWNSKFAFSPDSRILTADGTNQHVPVALITVGAFESIVPKLVVDRSVALTKLLSDDPQSTAIEQIDHASTLLGASVEAYVMGEKLRRYNDAKWVDDMIPRITAKSFQDLIGAEDQFFLLRALSDCLRPKAPFANIEEARLYRIAHPDQECAR